MVVYGVFIKMANFFLPNVTQTWINTISYLQRFQTLPKICYMSFAYELRKVLWKLTKSLYILT